MARRQFKLGSMHIKKRTEGTSNEISFSVLDAKSNSAKDQDAQSPHTVTELGKIQLFTLPEKQQSDARSATVDFSVPAGILAGNKPGVPLLAAGPVVSTQAEIAARKQKRTSRRLLNIAAVLALAGVLVFVGGNFALDVMERQQSDRVVIAESLSLLQQTDPALLALDEAVQLPASADQTALTTLFSDLSAAASLLDRAINSAEVVLQRKDEAIFIEEAAELKESATARKELIAAGRNVLTYASEAKSATTYIERAWDTTLVADARAREAAELIESGSAASITQSSSLATEALSSFQDALVLVRQAQTVYPQADFTTFETYLEKRSAAQQNALAGNAALAAQDTAAYEANNAAYNEAEEEAAQLVQNLAENPAQPIVDIYAQLGGQADEAYMQARARASRADEAVRAFSNNNE